MTGSAERRYFAVDGGAGGALLGQLRHASPRLIEVASPRHADLLIVAEPVSTVLAPFVAEAYRALPRPCAALGIGTPQSILQNVIPAIRRIAGATASAEAVTEEALAIPFDATPAESREPKIEPITMQLPSKHERDIATELVVVTLGPIQPLTAGPLRLTLMCDGEQIVSVRVDAGYAARDVAGAMRRSTWADAARLAADLDPLAPVAGRLAFISAVEQLQRRVPAAPVKMLRERTLALERATNHLSWLERFAVVLAHDALADKAARLRSGVSETPNTLTNLVRDLEALHSRLARDVLIASRTKRIGAVDRERLVGIGVTGPVLRASAEKDGDVRSRLLARLEDTLAFLRFLTADAGVSRKAVPGDPEDWVVPPGEAAATVVGPRGNITVRVRSTGGDSPATVEWGRPSSALLETIPHVLADQTLADAEVIVASLDIATAEADG